MHLLTFRGIPIRLHASFLLLAGGYVAWQLATAGGSAALGAAALGVLVFGSVLLHELGHAMAGRLFGIATRDITLYPFGGVARMAMADLRPVPELVVSLAGPLVNLGLALVGWTLAGLGVPLAAELAFVNLGLGLFNLLPAFPMDGGRVLRALLSLGRAPVAATRSALSLSRWFAWAFVVAAPLVGSWSLALVGGFLLLTVGAERRRLDHLEALQAARVVPVARWTEPLPEQRRQLGFGHPVR